MIVGGEMGKIIKDTIHANGIDIGIYTQDFDVMAEHMLIVILLCLSQLGFRLSSSYIL